MPMTVAACVPTRNRARYLREAVGSILAQTRLPDLVVISDDASADDTPAVVAEYSARLRAAGVRVRCFRHEVPMGQEANRRFCFEMSDADFVAMLDDDDLWRPEFLAATSAALSNHPECAFASTAQDIIDGDGHVMIEATERHLVGTGRFLLHQGVVARWTAMATVAAPFFIQATLFRRSALAAVGYIPHGSGGACDNATFLALAVRGALAYYLPARLAAYREHTTGRASDSAVQVARDHRDVCLAALSAAETEPDRRALRRGAIDWHRDLVMELAHRGMRRASLIEAVSLLRRWGAGAAGVRVLVYLPAVLLGADRLRRGRRPVIPSPRMWVDKARQGMVAVRVGPGEGPPVP